MVPTIWPLKVSEVGERLAAGELVDGAALKVAAIMSAQVRAETVIDAVMLVCSVATTLSSTAPTGPLQPLGTALAYGV